MKTNVSYFWLCGNFVVRSFGRVITIIALVLVFANFSLSSTTAGSTLNRLLHTMAANESYRVPIGYQTTRLTKPKSSDGLVDYLAAENNLLSKNVTTDNNAAIKFYDILGPVFCGNKTLWGPAYPASPAYPGQNRWQRHLLAIWHIPQRGASQGHIITLASFCMDKQANAPGTAPLSQQAQSLARMFLRHPWTSAKSDRLVQMWLAANEASLADIRAACELPHFYVPLITSRLSSGFHLIRNRLLISVGLNYLPAITDVARMLNADAAVQLHRGNVGACCRDLLAMHHLACLLSQQGDLVCLNNAWSIDEMACRADIAAVQSGKIPAREISLNLINIQRLHRFYPLAAMLNTNARWSSLDFFELCAAYPKIRSALVHTIYPAPKQLYWLKVWTKQYFVNAMILSNSLYDQEIAAFRIKPWHASMTAIFKAQTRCNQLSKSKPAYKRLVAFICCGSGPDEWGLLRAKWHAWRFLDVLSLALTSYRRDHGKFPEGLAQLSPKYLRAIPRDPFTGKPFQYSTGPAGCTIASPGKFPPGLSGLQGQRSGHALIVHLRLTQGHEK